MSVKAILAGRGVGDEVFVLHPDVNLVIPLTVRRFVLVVLVFGYDDLKYGLAVDFPFLGGIVHLRLAVHLGGGLYHVDLLVGTHTRDGAVVFHAHEETSAIGVGESGEGTGDASAVRNLELEVEHLVFALLDQVLDMVLFGLHCGRKDRTFFNAMGGTILIRCGKTDAKQTEKSRSFLWWTKKRGRG